MPFFMSHKSGGEEQAPQYSAFQKKKKKKHTAKDAGGGVFYVGIDEEEEPQAVNVPTKTKTLMLQYIPSTCFRYACLQGFWLEFH